MGLGFLVAGGLLVAACGVSGPNGSSDDDGGSSSSSNSSSSSSNSSSSSSGPGSSSSTGMMDANADGDCMTDAEELAIGTDPNSVDSDNDGTSDCDEIDCVSNPIDGNEVCYACGWKHNDPGDIVSTGSTVGSVMANFSLIDQCGDLVDAYDFAGAYRIFHSLPAW